jgi:outer membrane autotransporter protein
LLRITNAGGSGAQTVSNGILVVDAINGGTTATNAFSLAGQVVAGAYEYGLFRSSVDGSGPQNWYLRSTNIRPDVQANANVPPLGSQFGLVMLGTFHERMGDPLAGILATGKPAACDSSSVADGFGQTGKWGRLLGDKGSLSLNNANSSWQVGGMQAGMDLFRRESGDGSCDHAGLYFGIGLIDGDIDQLTQAGAGSIDINGYSIGAYWSRLGATGWYIDTVVQGTFYRANGDTGVTSIKTNGFGIAFSGEAGYPLRLTQDFWIEPQVQLIYQRVAFDDLTNDTGVASFAPTESLVGRIGARLVHPWETGSVWLRGNIWHEFIGKTSVTLAGAGGQNGVTFETPFDGTWGEVGIGANGRIADRTSLFATAAYRASLDGREREGWNARVGLTYQW